MSPWNRRSFLMAGAAGTAGLALDQQRRALTAAAKPWNADSGRALRKYRDPLPTVCRMCPAHCGLVACREGDRVVQVVGASGSPTNQGGLCPRAHAGLERLYDPDRVLTPLRRRGSRGGGQWEPVTWAAALEEIEGRLRKGGSRRVLHVGQEELLLQNLREAFGWTDVLVDELLPGHPGPGSGAELYGSPAVWPDFQRSRTVYLFGANVLEGRFSVPVARGLMAAREAGARLHLFGAYSGVTGSLSTWHRVNPGTEWVVALGMARWMLLAQRFDAELMAGRIGDGPENLKRMVEPYTPELVEKITGYPAGQLLRAADAFSRNRPSVALAPTGSPASLGVALLNHLSGAVDTPGGLATARGPFFVTALEPTVAPETWLERLVEGKTSADLYWVANANPAYDAPRAAEVSRALADPDRVGLFVAMDTHLTETARGADLFLPLATAFESWGLLEGSLPDGRTYLFLQQPVTRGASESRKLEDPKAEHLSLFEEWPTPLGEARSLTDVLLGLARKLGRAGPLAPYEDSRAYLGELLRRAWGPGSLEALRERGVWVAEDASPPTPATMPFLAPRIPKPPTGASAPLHLVGWVSSNLPRQYANSRWGLEVAHRCEAYVHPDTARRLGVADGDQVVLKTSAGEVRVAARVLQGIHPGAVALPDGLGHWAGGEAAQARSSDEHPRDETYLVKRRDLLHSPLGLGKPAPEPGDRIWWEEAGPGVSLRSLYPFRQGSEGAQDWGPLPVEVRKA